MTFRAQTWRSLVFCLLMPLGLGGCALFSAQPHRTFVVQRKWARSTLSKPFLGGRRIHRFSPIVTSDLIIEGNAIDGIVAFKRKTAELLWRIPIQDGVEGGAQLVNGILYFGAGDGQLYAVQPETGTIIWNYPLNSEGLGRPLVEGGVVYILAGNNVAHAIDAKTGKLLWVYTRQDASNLSIRGASQPVVSENLVYIGFSDGYLVALNKHSGNLVWEADLNTNKRFRDVDATPVLDGSNLYISSFDGRLFSLDKNTGKVIWAIDDGGYEEVLMHGRTLFLSTTAGDMIAVDKTSGKVYWSRPNPHGMATAPVFWRGVLIYGELHGGLRFLDARTGMFMAEFDPGRGVTAKPFIDEKTGEIFFMSADANLFCVKAGWKKHLSNWPWEESL